MEPVSNFTKMSKLKEYLIPGYTGHCPGYADRSLGKTFGRATRQTIEEAPLLRTILMPIRGHRFGRLPIYEDDDVCGKEQALKSLEVKSSGISRKGKQVKRGRVEDCFSEKIEGEKDTLGGRSSPPGKRWFHHSESMKLRPESLKIMKSLKLDKRVTAEISNVKKFPNNRYGDSSNFRKWIGKNSAMLTVPRETTGYNSSGISFKTQFVENPAIYGYTGVIPGRSTAIGETFGLTCRRLLLPWSVSSMDKH